MLTLRASWRTLSFLPPGPAALLLAVSQEDDRPHRQDRSLQAKQERQRQGKVGVPDRGYPVFQRHLLSFRGFCRDACSTWGHRGQGGLFQKLCEVRYVRRCPNCYQNLSSPKSKKELIYVCVCVCVSQTPELTNQMSLSFSLFAFTGSLLTCQTFQRHSSLVKTRFRQQKERGSAQALGYSGSWLMRVSEKRILFTGHKVSLHSLLYPLYCASFPPSTLNGCPVICSRIKPVQRLSCTDISITGKDGCTCKQNIAQRW